MGSLCSAIKSMTQKPRAASSYRALLWNQHSATFDGRLSTIRRSVARRLLLNALDGLDIHFILPGIVWHDSTLIESRKI